LKVKHGRSADDDVHDQNTMIQQEQLLRQHVHLLSVGKYMECKRKTNERMTTVVTLHEIWSPKITNLLLMRRCSSSKVEQKAWDHYSQDYIMSYNSMQSTYFLLMNRQAVREDLGKGKGEQLR